MKRLTTIATMLALSTTLALAQSGGGSGGGSSGGSAGGSSAAAPVAQAALSALEDKVAQELRLRWVPLPMGRIIRADQLPDFPLRPLPTQQLQGAVPVSTLPTLRMLRAAVIRPIAH